MGDFLTWLQTPDVLVMIGFHVFVLAMLALDLGIFQRHAHAVSMREAAIWSTVWIALALLFTVGIWQLWDYWHVEEADLGKGPSKALFFLAGYIVEKSLSVDNLFVFVVIFRHFAVPPHLQHRVLFWGILGALIMRATFILAGAWLLETFEWMIYVFGVFLLYTAYKLLRAGDEEIDPGKNILLRLARRILPVTNRYDSNRFWVRDHGKWFATPLPLVLLVVESTDVLFAIDSIPAIFGLFPPGEADLFIVYTSNIFAILGLRALYFLLAGFLGKFRYLNVGLALVLAFVGFKMLTGHFLKETFKGFLNEFTFIVISLGVIGTILTVSVIASLIAGPEKPKESAASPPGKAPHDSPPEEDAREPSAAESGPR
jgi:tellurite resistance protein TerC